VYLQAVTSGQSTGEHLCGRYIEALGGHLRIEVEVGDGTLFEIA
jgi:hypothetical protein